MSGICYVDKAKIGVDSHGENQLLIFYCFHSVAS